MIAAPNNLKLLFMHHPSYSANFEKENFFFVTPNCNCYQTIYIQNDYFSTLGL